jgi:hypothetical protein
LIGRSIRSALDVKVQNGAIDICTVNGNNGFGICDRTDCTQQQGGKSNVPGATRGGTAAFFHIEFPSN